MAGHRALHGEALEDAAAHVTVHRIPPRVPPVRRGQQHRGRACHGEPAPAAMGRLHRLVGVKPALAHRRTRNRHRARKQQDPEDEKHPTQHRRQVAHAQHNRSHGYGGHPRPPRPLHRHLDTVRPHGHQPELGAVEFRIARHGLGRVRRGRPSFGRGVPARGPHSDLLHFTLATWNPHRDLRQARNDIGRPDDDGHRVGTRLAREEDVLAAYVSRGRQVEPRHDQRGAPHLRTASIQLPTHRPARADANPIGSAHHTVGQNRSAPQNSYCQGPGRLKYPQVSPWKT